MKKRFLKYISAILSVVLMVTTFASCAPETPDNSGKMQNEIIVDNTNANVVSAYNKEGAYTLNIDAGDEIHDISDLLFGVFFEDI
ncbi:MAG: hypothetical protein IKW34_00135, partial [Clostridia bacterium]|nr:hypothetical protein [Clostridia bacterium]